MAELPDAELPHAELPDAELPDDALREDVPPAHTAQQAHDASPDAARRGNAPPGRGGRARGPAPRWARAGGCLAVPLAAALVAVAPLVLPPRYVPRAEPTPASFEAFVEARRARSRREHARPGCEERWARAEAGGDTLLLYVHGFVACRAEGERAVDAAAAALGVDAYYLRLPGHGTSPEDLGRRAFAAWVDEAFATLAAATTRYRRVVIVGTSLGAAIALELAAARPDDVTALVLASPFLDFRSKLAHAIALPFGIPLARALAGAPERRVPLDRSDPEDHRVPGFERYWYTRYPFTAVRELDRARRALAREATLARVHAPALLLLYPGDVAADPSAMRAAFARLGEARGPRRTVAVARGDHVLLSRWVDVDAGAVDAAVIGFLEEALAPGAPRTHTLGR